MSISQERRLRYAVIGVGAGVFSLHRAALRLPEVELVAVSDVNEEVGRSRASELNCPFYADHRQLLREVRPDVAVVLTPHIFHARIALDCLEAGSHVLVEKPMAVQVGEADAMIEAAARQQRILSVVFQHRFRPEVRAARALLQSGQLGSLQRITMNAAWPRPESYFALGSWRGTWAGEGGGVLMNQAAHNLDVLCCLVGLPQRVFAWTRQLLHHIETEDTVQASLEWANGALGSLHISTAEVDQPESIEIVGTHGRLELKHGQLSLELLDVDFRDFSASSPDAFASPRLHPVPIEMEAGKGDHSAVYRSLHTAILEHTLSGFDTDGTQGRMSLELANAMIYSSHLSRAVELPLEREGYRELLRDLQEQRRH